MYLIFIQFLWFLSNKTTKSCRIGFLREWGLGRVMCLSCVRRDTITRMSSLWWRQVPIQVTFFLQVNGAEKLTKMAYGWWKEAESREVVLLVPRPQAGGILMRDDERKLPNINHGDSLNHIFRLCFCTFLQAGFFLSCLSSLLLSCSQISSVGTVENEESLRWNRKSCEVTVVKSTNEKLYASTVYI